MCLKKSSKRNFLLEWRFYQVSKTVLNSNRLGQRAIRGITNFVTQVDTTLMIFKAVFIVNKKVVFYMTKTTCFKGLGGHQSKM